MNEKLKKILDALYRNSNDFQQACEKELCDPRIPSTPTHFVYYLTNGFTPESRYYALLKDNFLKTTQGVMDKKTEEEINELVAKFSSSSTFEDVKDFFKEEIKNWDKETQDKFLDNFDKVVKGKKYDGSFFIPIITTCVVTLAKSEKIDNLDEFYDTTTKLILASKPKTLSKNYIKKLVLEKIEAAFGKESSEYAETLTIINNAKKKEQLSSNSSEPSCFTSSEYRPLRYYQNGEPVYLIQNEKLLDLTTSIEDAIKTFDLNDNSNLLKFALEKIDDEVRKYFKDKGIDLKYAIPATEAVFLTLCHQLGKEVDDNVLFAISDPLSDMLSYSPFNEEILTAIKDICKEISGKEVEFGESDKKSSDETTPAEGHEHNHPENNTTTDSDEVTKPAGNPPVQNGPAQSLVKLPSKLAVAKLQKYAAEVLGTHGVFVGASGKAKYKNATPEQKNIIFQVNNAMLLPKKVKTITSKIVKNKTPSSYLDEDVDPSAEEIVSKLANVLAEIYSDHKSKLEKLRELQAEINKEPNEAKRNKLKTKFESQKEAYRAATNKEGLMKELKRRINNEVFRTVKAFGDDYSDNYK